MAISTVSFFSKSMRREVTFSALLPIDFPVIPGQTIDVQIKPIKTLYLLNGFSGSHQDWLTFSNIRELSDKYKIAIIMPAGENSFYVDDEDRGALYGEFIGKELVEFTRKLFPLSPDRNATFIGGLSMGGYGAIRNGLKYAENFGKIIAFSSAIMPYKVANAKPDYHDGIAGYSYFRSVFGDLDQLLGSDKDPEALVMNLKGQGLDIPELYIACGEEDFLLDVNQRFHQFLLQQQISHFYEESEGAHTWDFWNKSIEPALKWAAGSSSSL